MLTKVLILIITFVYAVQSLCFYPCNRLEVGIYYKVNNPGKNRISQFNCKHPSVVVTPERGEARECFTQNGPFRVQRFQGNKFRCVKNMAFDPSGKMAVFYAKPFRTYYKTPTLCEVCGAPDRWSVSIVAAQGISRKRAQRAKVPPMGCNVPKDCSINNPYTDVPCNGCEPKDEDLCCRGCQIQRNKYYA